MKIQLILAQHNREESLVYSLRFSSFPFYEENVITYICILKLLPHMRITFCHTRYYKTSCLG